MPRVIEGKLDATDLKFAIVVSRFNEFISDKLLGGALDCLNRHNASEDDIEIVWAPGSFELPLVAKTMAESGRFNAVICIGAVIRGSTSHFDYVAGEAAKGIALAAMQTGVPVIFGVITTETIEQAIERSGAKLPNRGFEAAATAIEMANVMKQIGRQE
jgi:6,7-dimethyl-8-ribityllumazine synthase